MFKSLKDVELMSVNGGSYPVPMIKNGKVVDTKWVASNSNIKCYKWEYRPGGYQWVIYYN